MHRILFGCLSQACHVGHTKGICLWRGDLYSIHGCQMIIEDLLQINRVTLLGFGGNSLGGRKHTANTTTSGVSQEVLGWLQVMHHLAKSLI